MNRDCRRIRELLSAHLDGELAGADEHRVEKHLSECAECRAILAAYREADAALAADMVALTESEWERLAMGIDDAIAHEASPAQQKHRPDREAAGEPAGLRARWRSLLGGMSPRRLSLGALGSLTVAALIILLFPWREEVQISEKVEEEKAIPVPAREGPKKGGGERGASVLREERETAESAEEALAVGQGMEAPKEDRPATLEGSPALARMRAVQEPISDEARFEQLRVDANEAIRGGGVAEALAAAQSLDGFLTDSPASDHRLEALELAARVWVRLAEIDPARHCPEARERIRAWEAAAGDSASPRMRELVQGFRRGPCAL